MARLKYFDRYKRVRNNGNCRVLPFIEIPTYDTDLYVTFEKAVMRLDNLSYKYYSSPDYAWLIMLANPSLGSLEYLIQDGVRMRIPYPLDTALSRYENGVTTYLDSTV